MTRLIIVRHGNTFGSNEQVLRIGSRTDLPLTRYGTEQAATLGRWLVDRGISIHQALSGPLCRATQTAQIILETMETTLRPRSVDWLDEIDHGPDEGKPEEEVIARIGRHALEAWDRGGSAPPGWRVNRHQRIAAWRRLFAEAPNANTLLVTSSGAARFALLAIGLTPRSSLKLRTGACGELVKTADGDWLLESWDSRP